MPVSIITVEEARPKTLRLAESSIKTTRTYNEAADMIRQGHVPAAIKVTFTAEEIALSGIRNVYPCLKSHLERVAKKNGQLDLKFVAKKDGVTVYREQVNGQAYEDKLKAYRQSL